jgi:uncharacterized membrane protein YGL010W
MNALIKQLSTYATYHRDPRNIATHFFGVPMIFVAVCTFLSRPMFEVAGLHLAPVYAVGFAAAIFYLRLDVRFGLVMTVSLVLSALIGAQLAAQSTVIWLCAATALFVVGWIIQFVGHFYEGKKPAFVDDLVGLLIGPLFVTAELGFLLDLRLEVKAEIEKQAGPTRLRVMTSIAN